MKNVSGETLRPQDCMWTETLEMPHSFRGTEGAKLVKLTGPISQDRQGGVDTKSMPLFY